MSAIFRQLTGTGLPVLALLAACGASSGQSASVDGKNGFDGQIADVASDVVVGADAAPADVAPADAAPADVAPADVASGCDVAAVAAALAGPGALDCGHSTLADPSVAKLQEVYGCAVAAMKAGKNVFALIDEQGIDAKITTAVVRRPSGAIGLLRRISGNFLPPYDAIHWQTCTSASFAKPAGVDAFFCAPDSELVTLCPGTAQPQEVATPVVQWTAQDMLIQVQPHQAPAFPPQPTPWTQLKVQKGAGPCPPGATCSWTWTIDANGTVIASPPNAGKKLSLAEVQQLWELLGSALQLPTELNCPPPPTDISYTMSYYVGGTQNPQWTQDVTGCVIGDSQSVPAKVMKLLE